MFAKKRTLYAMLLTITACVNAEPKPAYAASECPEEVQEVFNSVVGEWDLSVQADEGWTGYGRSSISWVEDQRCGIMERSVAVFNQESEAPTENKSTVHLAYDELSGTIKVLTADNRGYVHIGIAEVQDPLKFQVLKSVGEIPNRQIRYQNIRSESFEWSWNGRVSPSDDWEERLVISYKRAR